MTIEEIMQTPQKTVETPTAVLDPDDPLLIAQSLTYITDDGSVVLNFSSAPFSFGKRCELMSS